MNQPPKLLQAAHLHPKYWHIWLALLIAWLVTRCPHSVRLRIGECIGLLGYLFAKRRRHIVSVNLNLCFPDLSQPDRARLVKSVFLSVGTSLIETCLAWLQPYSRYQHLFTLHGLDELKAAADKGNGVILLGMHLATLDICGAGTTPHFAMDVMYRRNKNKLLEAFMTRGRVLLYPAALERGDVKQVVRNLKKGHIVWYGPDQDYGRKHSVFALFFGIPAASITATARIARITGAAIVVYYHYRREDRTGYDLYFEPLSGYPVDDEVASATIVNARIETIIRRHPDQYWWLHRRFKTRPAGEARPY